MDVPEELLGRIEGVTMTASPSSLSELDLVDAAGAGEVHFSSVEFLEKRFLLSVEFIAALAEDVVRQREAKEMMSDDAKGSGRGSRGQTER